MAASFNHQQQVAREDIFSKMEQLLYIFLEK